VKPEEWHILREIGEPNLPAVVKAGGEALLRVAEYLEQLCDHNEDVAPAAEGHVRNGGERNSNYWWRDRMWNPVAAAGRSLPAA
jgi:hypothetical protein